eukprot:gene36647-24594_t
MQGVTQHLQDSITEVSTSGGQKIMQHVEKFVGKHVVEWYGPVRLQEERDSDARLAALQADIEGRLRGEIAAQTDRQQRRISEVAATASSDLLAAVAEKEKQVSQIQKTRETDMSQVTVNLRGIDDWHKRAEAEAAGKAHARFVDVETRAAALFHALCLDEDECRELLEDARKVHDRHALGGDEADRRVDVMHNTKPYLELRAKIQRDIRSRVKQSKEEDQDDFSAQISELQRELKSKCTVQRVTEIVHDSTDRTLYDSVDFVKAKVQALETEKVGSDSDAKQLEQKADRAYVAQIFEFLRSKVEQLAESTTKD